MKKNNDIIIIGAGPAGLTAAIYAARAGKSVLVFEAKTFGGQITSATTVVNYPGIKEISGSDYAYELYEQATSFGAEVKFEKVIDVDVEGNIKIVKTKEKNYKTKALILATGAFSRPLGLDGEEKYIGKGVSYCATCDGNFFKKQDVAIVGGGDTALTDAIYLAGMCKKVYIVHRRDTFRGSESYVRKLKKLDNVEFILNSQVTKLIGRNKLEKIEITDNDDNKYTIEVNGLFIAIGQVPENGNFKELIDVDDAGYFEADEDCHTKIPGIFVAGDSRIKTLRQLTTAVGDGSVAATEACDYLDALDED
ncbi:MAG: thioredoxin-disulfide reductase [Bacilli bacterium]|nr:thioredoxin-disulfide reductase [Bacilli bacterium]